MGQLGYWVRHEMKRSGVPTFFFRICEEKRKCPYLGCRTGQLHVGCWLGQLGCWLQAGTVRMLSRTAGMLWVGQLGCWLGQ